ncbi:MAG: FtsX-like permease family protein [bacterium]|nr:FtsX-like permease family protein [bacterium]
MKQFGKNVFRLALHSKGSLLGAVCIIAIGIFIYVAMADTLRNLSGQIEVYYEERELADVFASVSGISSTELERLQEIPGIEEASGKMAVDVRMLAEGQEEIVTLHLLSYDKEDTLNQIQLSDSLTVEEELFLGARMAGIYGYEKGEELTLLWKGKRIHFSFAGECYAPDYIYSIPPGGAMIPDGEVYDIAVISKEKMEELLGKKDSLNELGFRLSEGYRYEQLRAALTEALSPYGLLSLSEREKQSSVNMVNGEMEELIAMGSILPILFMSISVFMLYVVLKKRVDREQSLIGTMKAFGMRDGELMAAYLLEGAVVGTMGAGIGSVLAVPFGQLMFRMYVDFFNLPDTLYHSYAASRIQGFLLAVGTACLAVFFGVRGILHIAPAEAMRPQTPTAARMLPLPNLFLTYLGFLQRMACRSIARNPFRGFLIVLAVGFPFAMTSVLLSFQGVADQMFLDQFTQVQQYDFQLSLDRYLSPLRAAEGAEQLEGVTEAEAVLLQTAKLRRENASEFVMLYALHPDSDLWKVKDLYQRYYKLPKSGIILNTRIAEKLHVKEGDVVELSCEGFTLGEVSVPVHAVIAESIGNGCYINLDSLEQWFPAKAAANTVLLRVKEGQKAVVKERLLQTSRVTWLVDTKKIVTSYEDLMASMLAMVAMFAGLSVAAGGILIYHISMINIRERVTEFGTLMILGESEKEIASLLLFEQLLYFGLGILAGLPASRGIKYLIEKTIISDSYTMDLQVHAGGYVLAFGICLGITLLAYLAESRFIRSMELTDILKERE